MSKRKQIVHTINLLEDYLQQFTEAVFNKSEVEQIISKKYFDAVVSECKLAMQAFTILENDPKLIAALNALQPLGQQHQSQLTVKQFFIADCIQMYQQLTSFRKPHSAFALAYYFDAILNNHFADDKALSTLNTIIVQQDFLQHLEKLIEKNKLKLNHPAGELILPGMIKQMLPAAFEPLKNAYQNFVALLLHQSGIDQQHTAVQQVLQAIVKPKGDKAANVIDADDTLEKVMAELNALIGLENVKKEISDLVNLLTIQKKRTAAGLKNPDTSLHIAFLGAPGTGKTTVARLLGRIYKHLGLLDKGHLTETDREGMVAGYVGQTALKVDALITQSIEGVLFIDEAYSLANNVMGNDFGKEAIDALIKRMEDYRKDIAVIIAGYTEPMKALVESNPGLRSRFNRFFQFDHFNPEQLLQIFQSFCKKADFELDAEANEKLADTFAMLYEKRDDGFGNARVVRNLFEKCVQMQANRIVAQTNIDTTMLKTITQTDVPEPKDTLHQVYFTAEEKE